MKEKNMGYMRETRTLMHAYTYVMAEPMQTGYTQLLHLSPSSLILSKILLASVYFCLILFKLFHIPCEVLCVYEHE